MRLKSLSVANHRIKITYVAKILICCLLTGRGWSFANIQPNRFVRQANDEAADNYEDSSTTNPYHQPHFTGNRSVVVQLFEWKFVDIAAECRDFLGPQGYAGVQLSPVLEHTVVKTGNLSHPWWERLEVISYRLASRSGDEAEFWSMSRICNENGVRIYVDVVLNHMAAPLHYVGVGKEDTEDFVVDTLLETNVNFSQLNYGHVGYTQNDFHKPVCMVLANTQDAHVIRNCRLNGHPDLDHARSNVQKRIVEMLNKFVDMGVAGFRIDAAKYIWPIDLKKIFQQVKNLSTEFNFKKNARPFVYFDVFDLGLDAVSKTEYSTYGVVSEYLYAAELSTILRGKVPLSSLINWGPALGFLPHEDSLVFIDSHDTQRDLPWELGSNRMLTYKQRIEYIMANVFMLVHPYGAIKRIMSSYYFPKTDTNQGPPVEEADEEEIRSPRFNERNQCTRESGWVCEHRWPQMVSLIKVANYFRHAGNKEESVIYFQANGPNQVAFCRGQKAFIAINNDVENDFIKEVYGCLEPGVYCDMVTGGKKDGREECHGKVLEINEQRYIKLQVNVGDSKRGNNGWVGIELEEKENYDEEEKEEEEETGAIHSYGIVVIYVESKINPAAENKAKEEPNEVNGTQTGEATENPEENKGNEDKPSAEDGQAVDQEENATEQEQQQNNHADNEEPAEEQKEDEEAAEGEEEKAEEEEVNEVAVEENSVEVKSENDEQIKESISNQETSSEISEPDGNQNSNDPKEIEEANRSNENDLSEENGNEHQNEETDIEEVEVENENNKEVNTNSLEKEEEEEAKTENSVNEEDDKQEPDDKQDSDEGTSQDVASGEDPAASSDTGHNQSRNLDEINADETGEQIEKPSAEIVDEAIDISDTVTAKIQDIQKAGIFTNHQGEGSNG